MSKKNDGAQSLTRTVARRLLPSRAQESNKGTFGNVLNIAGSPNYRGAAYLSSVSALKVGAGYSTLACPEATASTVASLGPDIVTVALATEGGSIRVGESERVFELSKKYKAVSVGCGLFSFSGDNAETKLFFAALVSSFRSLAVPVVIDADGITILSEIQPFALPARAILTPHPAEMGRLLGVETAIIQADRIGYARKAAVKYSAVIVLKGHRTIVTDGSRVFINTTGNSALAKAGSGDVLAGMIAGLCAQGLSPLDGACLGVYLHGKAGELGSKKLTEYSLLASDILTFIPEAIRTLL